MRPYLDPLLKKTSEKLDMENSALQRATSDATLRVVGLKFWAAIHSEKHWKLREAAAQAYMKFLQDPKGPVFGRYKNDHHDLFKATTEVAEICLNDKLLQIFNVGLQIIGLAFKD